jgi:hypothetical protein
MAAGLRQAQASRATDQYAGDRPPPDPAMMQRFQQARTAAAQRPMGGPMGMPPQMGRPPPNAAQFRGAFGAGAPRPPAAGGVFGMRPPAGAAGAFGPQTKAPMMTGQAPGLSQLAGRMPGFGSQR